MKDRIHGRKSVGMADWSKTSTPLYSVCRQRRVDGLTVDRGVRLVLGLSVVIT